MIQKEI
jgi:hypothetical protein